MDKIVLSSIQEVLDLQIEDSWEKCVVLVLFADRDQTEELSQEDRH